MHRLASKVAEVVEPGSACFSALRGDRGNRIAKVDPSHSPRPPLSSCFPPFRLITATTRRRDAGAKGFQCPDEEGPFLRFFCASVGKKDISIYFRLGWGWVGNMVFTSTGCCRYACVEFIWSRYSPIQETLWELQIMKRLLSSTVGCFRCSCITRIASRGMSPVVGFQCVGSDVRGR